MCCNSLQECSPAQLTIAPGSTETAQKAEQKSNSPKSLRSAAGTANGDIVWVLQGESLLDTPLPLVPAARGGAGQGAGTGALSGGDGSGVHPLQSAEPVWKGCAICRAWGSPHLLQNGLVYNFWPWFADEGSERKLRLQQFSCVPWAHSQRLSKGNTLTIRGEMFGLWY